LHFFSNILQNFYLHKAQIEILMSLRKWQLISNVYETGEWPKNVTEVGMIALKEKSKATK